MAKAAAVTGITCLVILCAACSSEKAEPSSGSIGLEIMLDPDPRSLSSLLHERELIFQDEVAACMSLEGFDYFPVDDSSEVQLIDELFDLQGGSDPAGRALGLMDREYAEEHGFGFVDRFVFFQAGRTSLSRESRNEVYFESLNEPERVAYGSALGECERQAGQSVGFDSVNELMEIASELRMAVAEKLLADPVVVELDRAWAQCLAERGQYFDAIPDRPIMLYQIAFDHIIDRIEGGSPTQDELRDLADLERQAAVASLDCAEAVDYSNTIADRHSHYQEAELDARGY